jgi:hypothetical protein
MLKYLEILFFELKEIFFFNKKKNLFEIFKDILIFEMNIHN